jgi:hypothetical protein
MTATYEVHADSAYITFRVCIILMESFIYNEGNLPYRKSQKKTRFSDPRVSNKEELKKIVARKTN